jgi:putative sigma-54 modulation protein
VASDFHAALDQALAALTAQIRRKKERVTAKKPRRAPAPRAGLPAEPAEETLPGSQVVIRRTNAKPMSLEEAVDQLRLQAAGFLVFRNARTRAVNVLRQRPDGAVELVEPAG